METGGGELLILDARAAGGTRHAAGGRGVVGMAVVGVVREGSFRLYGMCVVGGAGGCAGVRRCVGGGERGDGGHILRGRIGEVGEAALAEGV